MGDCVTDNLSEIACKTKSCKRVCRKCKRVWVVIYAKEGEVCPICCLKG